MPRHRCWGRLVCGLIFLSLGGCVNYAPLQQQRLAISDLGLDQGLPVALKGVPFYPQESYQCGPSALASVLNFAGRDVSPTQLVDEVYVPARQGSLQPFMVAATRKRGLLPYVRTGEGLPSLLQELQAGRPVLVLQNLGLPQLPNWHYAVVIGWQPSTQTLTLRSGNNAEQTRSLKFFEYTWRASNYWSLTIYSSNQTPIAAEQGPWLAAAAGLEAAGQLEAAWQAYLRIEQLFPRQLLAVMGQGNVAYQLQRFSEAEAAYRKALSLTDKPYAPAHNLAWALIRQGKLAAAEPFALQAKEQGGSDYQSAWQALQQTQ